MVFTRRSKRTSEGAHVQRETRRSKTGSNIISPSSGTGTGEQVLPPPSSIGEKKCESIASYYSDSHLRPAGWTLFYPKMSNFGWIPVQYQEYKDIVRKIGEKGKHYAEGSLELYDMIRKYGKFEGKSLDSGYPMMVSYMGPPLPTSTSRPNSTLIYDADLDQESDEVASLREANGFEVHVLQGQDSNGRKLHTPTPASCPNSPFFYDRASGDDAASLRVVNGFEVHILQGDPNTREIILPHGISEDHWKQGNPMSYRYLENVLESTQNNIFVGKMRGEICSLFCFCHTGSRGKEDATVLLLWTKFSHRQKGLSTCLMHEGIQFLANGSHIMSGSRPTELSRRVFVSQNWKRVGDHFATELRALRETLQIKCNQKGTGSDSDWGASIKNTTIELYKEPIAADELFDMSPVSAAAPRNTGHISTIDGSFYDVSPVSDVVARNTALASARSNRVMVATSSISKNTHLKLLEFLQNVETSKCIKGRIEDFVDWLDKEDVKSIADLQEAVQDDEYLKNDLHEGNGEVGIKGFKRWKFKELVMRQL